MSREAIAVDREWVEAGVAVVVSAGSAVPVPAGRMPLELTALFAGAEYGGWPDGQEVTVRSDSEIGCRIAVAIEHDVRLGEGVAEQDDTPAAAYSESDRSGEIVVGGLGVEVHQRARWWVPQHGEHGARCGGEFDVMGEEPRAPAQQPELRSDGLSDRAFRADGEKFAVMSGSDIG